MIRRTALRIALCLTIYGLCVTSSPAQIQTAGDLLVDLTATSFDAGTGIWSNNPSCTTCLGDFTGESGPTPVTTAEGVAGIGFNGTAFFTGPAAPAGLTGLDPTRSIEVWALNPAVADEETLVSWGRRGGPDGSNMSFNYGNHQAFGAVGHWGGPDKGWNNDDATPGSPPAGEWNYLVYTYDGTTTRVYSNGSLVGSEELGAGVINTHAIDDGSNPLPIRIGSQNDANGVATAALRANGMLIGGVRIHDGVLSDSQILTNFSLEDGSYPDPTVEPPTPMQLSSGPVNRYSFSEAATGDATGTTIVDSVGGANGVVLGAGSSTSGMSLSFNGGGSDTAAYVDLPNNIISVHTDATIEGWFTLDGSQNWSRVFDFGSSQAGEPMGPGGSGEGLDYILLSAQIGGDSARQRLEINNRDPVGGEGGGAVVDVTNPTPLGEEYHFAAVYDTDGSFLGQPAYKVYINGELLGEASPTAPLSALNDVNNWLGRSNWTGDANTQGTYNEFRIYDRALSPGEVLGNFDAGADTINLVPEPASLIAFLFGLSVLMMRWDSCRAKKS